MMMSKPVREFHCQTILLRFGFDDLDEMGAYF